MSQEWAKSFYNSKRWKECKRSFVAAREAIDGGMCMDCHEQLGYICHHWPIMLTESNVSNANVSLSHGNLRWVCKDCHDKYPGHGVGDSLTEKVLFDSEGNVLPPIKNVKKVL